MNKIKLKICMCAFFVNVSGALGMDDFQETTRQTNAPYKLEGIFTTKINSIKEVNPADFTKGDVVFFDCFDMFHGDVPSFFHQIQERGAECFGMVGRMYGKYHATLEQSFARDNIYFSSLIEDKTDWDNNCLIDKGLLYRGRTNDKFWLHDQINNVLCSLGSLGYGVNRVVYFANDPFELNFMLGKMVIQRPIIYFIPPKEMYGWYRFFLSDEPSTHWAYTEDEETQVAMIRENPLILADVFIGPKKEKITYERILTMEVLWDAFDKKEIVDPNPVLKLFLLRQGGYVELAQKLSKIDNEMICRLVPFMEKLMKEKANSRYYNDFLDELMAASSVEEMEIYTNQILSLFEQIDSSHLKKSCLQSWHKMPVSQRQDLSKELLECLAEWGNELEIAVVLAAEAWVPCFHQLKVRNDPSAQQWRNILSAKVCNKVLPFEFFQNLAILEESLINVFLRYFPKSQNYSYKDMIDALRKYNPEPLKLVYILDQICALGNRLEIIEDSMDFLSMDYLIQEIIKLSKDENHLRAVFSGVEFLVKGMEIKRYSDISEEIKLLASLADAESIWTCVETTRLVYDVIPHTKLYMRDLLRIITSMASNEERREGSEEISSFLNERFISAIKKKEREFLGDKAKCARGVCNLMKLTRAHKKFLMDVMGKTDPKSFQWYADTNLTYLAEGVAAIPEDRHADVLKGFCEGSPVDNTYDLVNKLWGMGKK